MSITFIDIETVPIEQQLPEPLRALYKKKFLRETQELVKDKYNADNLKLSDVDFDNHWEQRAGLYAEFGKIVAISLGKTSDNKFFVKGLAGRDEKKLLEQFLESLEKSKAKILCAHNGREFDFPYLMRRLIINNLPVPDCLNTVGKKPWDVTLEDTMQMWSGNQWNYKVSLDLLCHVLNVPTPKIEINGSDVAKIYYGMFDVQDDQLPFDKEAAALRQISKYCSMDVVATAECYFKMKRLPAIETVEYL